MSNPEAFCSKLRVCVVSTQSFEIHFTWLYHNAINFLDDYADVLVDFLSKTLLTEIKSSTQKFYALYVTFLFSRVNNTKLLLKLAAKGALLTYIFKAAQCTLSKNGASHKKDQKNHKKDQRFFLPNPQDFDIRISKNFTKLCFEAILQWSESCRQIDDLPSSLHIFESCDHYLKKHSDASSPFHFIANDYALGQELASWNFATGFPRLVNETESTQKTCEQLTMETTVENRSQLRNSIGKNEQNNLTDINLMESVELDGDEKEDRYVFSNNVNKRGSSTGPTEKHDSLKTVLDFLERADPEFKKNDYSNPQQVDKNLEYLKEQKNETHKKLPHFYQRKSNLQGVCKEKEELKSIRSAEITGDPNTFMSKNTTNFGRISLLGIPTHNMSTQETISNSAVLNRQIRKETIQEDQFESNDISNKSTFRTTTEPDLINRGGTFPSHELKMNLSSENYRKNMDTLASEVKHSRFSSMIKKTDTSDYIEKRSSIKSLFVDYSPITIRNRKNKTPEIIKGRKEFTYSDLESGSAITEFNSHALSPSNHVSSPSTNLSSFLQTSGGFSPALDIRRSGEQYKPATIETRATQRNIRSEVSSATTMYNNTKSFQQLFVSYNETNQRSPTNNERVMRHSPSRGSSPYVKNMDFSKEILDCSKRITSVAKSGSFTGKFPNGVLFKA